MLSCKDVTARATAFLERDLSWWERVQMRLHLAMCAACQRYLAQMAATRELLRRFGQTLAGDERVDPALRDAFRAWRDESRRS
jgi:predicted anti-sigma-YlaC factor YlaD